MRPKNPVAASRERMDYWLWTALIAAAEIGLQFFFVGLVLSRGSGRPASNLAWIVVILSLPVLGMVLYSLVGEVRLGDRRMRRHREIHERSRDYVTRQETRRQYPELDPQYRALSALAEAVGGNAPRAGNVLRLIGDTDVVIDSLVADIDAATDHCHLLFYIYLADQSGRKVAEALGRAARRGVACRLLVDAVGSRDFLASDLCRRLEESGARVVGALPANLVRATFARLDLRNHRKLAVIDGRLGYTGSQNIADDDFAIKPNFAPWVDAMLRIEGPAVLDLQQLFVEDWFLDADEPLEELLARDVPILPDGVPIQIMGTGPNSYNQATRQLAQAAFHDAREELILTTPYFVPDEATVGALAIAARRGVRTRVVLPRRNDSPLVSAASRSFYEGMLDAGVHIHEYTKGLLHAKTLTVDRDLAFVSTANFDRRSFELNFEVSTIVYDSDFASQLRFLQRSYIEDSVEISRSRWRARAWPKRIVQNAAGMLSPLL